VDDGADDEGYPENYFQDENNAFTTRRTSGGGATAASG
jgi:hypothetical protein